MLAAQAPPPPAVQTSITMVSKDTTTDAGEPIRYFSTPNPEVTSLILSLPPSWAVADLDDSSSFRKAR